MHLEATLFHLMQHDSLVPLGISPTRRSALPANLSLEFESLEP